MRGNQYATTTQSHYNERRGEETSIPCSESMVPGENPGPAQLPRLDSDRSCSESRRHAPAVGSLGSRREPPVRSSPETSRSPQRRKNLKSALAEMCNPCIYSVMCSDCTFKGASTLDLLHRQQAPQGHQDRVLCRTGETLLFPANVVAGSFDAARHLSRNGGRREGTARSVCALADSRGMVQRSPGVICRHRWPMPGTSFVGEMSALRRIKRPASRKPEQR
jgi:hypothetical protein